MRLNIKYKGKVTLTVHLQDGQHYHMKMKILASDCNIDCK